ncbi:MAG: methyltransferase protein [Rariglobus sp.]|nr:methyltransferase protein [Rariglobus sp.]
MSHNDLYAAVGRVLAAHFANRSFSVLDLGCGSGRHLAPVLATLPVHRYEGHDLSGVAIEHARSTFASSKFPVRLCTGDLRDSLTAEGPPVDVVFSGFTLHHLMTEERASVLENVQRRLAPGGLVLWVDSCREEGQSRAAWLDAYCGWIEAEWRGIPPEGLAAIVDHIRECDQPGTVREYSEAAVRAGFAPMREHLRRGWHGVWSCVRPG